jgi:hypothetical protein
MERGEEAGEGERRREGAERNRDGEEGKRQGRRGAGRNSKEKRRWEMKREGK